MSILYEVTSQARSQWPIKLFSTVTIKRLNAILNDHVHSDDWPPFQMTGNVVYIFAPLPFAPNVFSWKWAPDGSHFFPRKSSRFMLFATKKTTKKLWTFCVPPTTPSLDTNGNCVTVTSRHEQQYLLYVDLVLKNWKTHQIHSTYCFIQSARLCLKRYYVTSTSRSNWTIIHSELLNKVN